MPTKTLLSFTGGMETTYIAWKLLTETDDEITLLYLQKQPDVEMRNIDAYPEIIQQAQPLLDYLQNIRPFNLIIKDIAQEEITPDTDHYYTFLVNYAIPLINAGTYDRLVTGRAADQAGQKVLADQMGSPSSIAGQRLWDAHATRGSLWHPLVTGDFGHEGSKPYIVDLLPYALKEKTFSCVIPVVGLEKLESCGMCFKCLWLKKIDEMMQDGMSPEEIDEWRVERAFYYGGGTVMAPFRYWIYMELGIQSPPFVRQPNFATKEDLQAWLSTHKHYSTNGRPNTGIWEGLV